MPFPSHHTHREYYPSLPLAKNFFKDQAKKLRNLLDFFQKYVTIFCRYFSAYKERCNKMFVECYKNHGVETLRLVEGKSGISKNGKRTVTKRVIMTIGPLRRFDDGLEVLTRYYQPSYVENFQLFFRRICTPKQLMLKSHMHFIIGMHMALFFAIFSLLCKLFLNKMLYHI